MLVNFNPAISNRKSNNPTFQKVNQEWLAKIVKNPNEVDNLYVYFLDRTTGLKKQDAIDTVTAALAQVGEGFKQGLRDIIGDIKAVNRN